MIVCGDCGMILIGQSKKTGVPMFCMGSGVGTDGHTHRKHPERKEVRDTPCHVGDGMERRKKLPCCYDATGIICLTGAI